MSSILLIGNGPSALERKAGKIIDSDRFDVVARFNRGHMQDDGTVNTGFEENVGTRCDWWFINDLRIRLLKDRVEEYKEILVYTPRFKWDENIRMSTEEKFSNVTFIPTVFEDSINEIVDFNPTWPSTGVVGIHLAVHNFDEVYLYGFDTYDKKYDNLHYFEDKPNKYKQGGGSDHTPEKEKFYLEHMLKNNKINLL